MNNNLFAYTPATGIGYPPYVSINRLDNGDVKVTVRSGPTIVKADAEYAIEGDTVSVVVPAAEWKL
jgi:hypothetical protein